MQELEQMLTTVDIAEMMGMQHKTVLRKIEGRKTSGNHVDGIIDVLRRHHLVPSEYFVKSTYANKQNKEIPCYKVTRKGCEFLANKFQGEKGIIFTARYIERFHRMEEMIRSGITQSVPLPDPPTKEPAPALPEIPKFRGNHIDHKDTAALFIKQYIAENGGSFGVYRAYRSNQMEHSDVILPYNMFRRVQIRTENFIMAQAMA